MKATCKFCSYEGEGFRDCELYTDPETHETTLCGNLECPMCYACQGNPVTPELTRACTRTRVAHEVGIVIDKLTRLLAGADAIRRRQVRLRELRTVTQ